MTIRICGAFTWGQGPGKLITIERAEVVPGPTEETRALYGLVPCRCGNLIDPHARHECPADSLALGRH